MANAWGNSWGGDTGSWLATWASEADLTVTDTDILQLPIDAQLHDRPLLWKRRSSVFGGGAVSVRTQPGQTMSNRPGRIRGGRPEFTVRTSKKGFD